LSEWFFLNGERLKVSVVFVSSDRSEADMREYFGHHSWDLAVPFDAPQRRELGATYGVRSPLSSSAPLLSCVLHPCSHPA